MSVVGTGIAAGVSQAGLQAQQVAREVDRKKAQNSEDARKIRERFEAHLQTLEDPDQVEAVDRLRIDGHAPQDQPSDSEGHEEPTADSPPEQTTQQIIAQTSPSTSPQKNDEDGSLYHHLDVKG